MIKSHASALPRREVTVLVDTATGWGRRLIQGVINYAQKQGAWNLRVEPAGRSEATRLPSDWSGDGIIARVVSQPMAARLRATGKPVVNVSGVGLKGVDFPRVTTNYRASAALAAEHFLERGFRHFGYAGPFNLAYVREHRDAFASVLAEHGYKCAIHDYRAGAASDGASQRRMDWLQRWLEYLPKPAGVFTWGTTPGIYVLQACARQQIAVPDEIAVLGGDDDRLLCEAASPPLSGILVASEQIGYTAARYLDQLMSGDETVERDVQIEPIDITMRQSTDVLALHDKALLQAVIYIRQNAYRPLTVTEVLEHVPMSRRSLERQFKQAFGRSPWQEISRLRMSRCRQLLAQTDAPIPQVATNAGFASPEHMTTLFKREHGVTPLKYRSRVRGR